MATRAPAIPANRPQDTYIKPERSFGKFVPVSRFLEAAASSRNHNRRAFGQTKADATKNGGRHGNARHKGARYAERTSCNRSAKRGAKFRTITPGRSEEPRDFSRRRRHSVANTAALPRDD